MKKYLFLLFLLPIILIIFNFLPINDIHSNVYYNSQQLLNKKISIHPSDWKLDSVTYLKSINNNSLTVIVGSARVLTLGFSQANVITKAQTYGFPWCYYFKNNSPPLTGSSIYIKSLSATNKTYLNYDIAFIVVTTALISLIIIATYWTKRQVK